MKFQAHIYFIQIYFIWESNIVSSRLVAFINKTWWYSEYCLLVQLYIMRPWFWLITQWTSDPLQVRT